MVVLRQIKVNCPNCGEFLFRVFRQLYDMDKMIHETSEYTPVCKTCNIKEYFEAMKNAGKIEMLHIDDKSARIYSSPIDEGDKIQKLTGRKPVESDESFE